MTEMVRRTLQALAYCYKQRAFDGLFDQSRYRLYRNMGRMPAFDLDGRWTGTVGVGLNLGGWTQCAPLSAFMLTETE